MTPDEVLADYRTSNMTTSSPLEYGSVDTTPKSPDDPTPRTGLS
jgi:hypothetical protein